MKDHRQQQVFPVYFKTSVGETKVFDVTFYPQDLFDALDVSYSKDYYASDKGREFLQKVASDLQSFLKTEQGHNISSETAQSIFLKTLVEMVLERILYRLEEKLVNRLLSIITEGQAAAERKVEIRHGWPQQSIKKMLDDIFFNKYELSRDVLHIREGRRLGSLNKPKPMNEQQVNKADRELEILRAMFQLLDEDPGHKLYKKSVGCKMYHNKKSSGRSKLYSWLKSGIDYDSLKTIARNMYNENASAETLKGEKGRELLGMYKRNMT